MASDPAGALGTARVAALCDGVFAIAMTILVLSIAVPTAETVPAERLPGALRQLAPQVLVYVISFINLGVLWVGQHNQYHFISRADRWFLWINIGYLLLVSFMPLSTALLGHYPLNRLALFVYGANLLTATLVLALHWHYATVLPHNSFNLPGAPGSLCYQIDNGVRARNVDRVTCRNLSDG